WRWVPDRCNWSAKSAWHPGPAARGPRQTKRRKTNADQEEPVNTQGTTSDAEQAKQLHDGYERRLSQLDRVIVGQRQVIEELLITIFARGHCLLMGVPGLAKTLLVSTLAQSLDLGFKRIQFTPDLMPTDITGTEVIQDDPTTGERRFKF